MSSVSEKIVVRARPAPPTLRISVWPMRDEPGRSWALIAVLIGVSAICGLAAGHFAVGLLFFGLLSLTVKRLWLPVTYELSSKGVVYSSLVRRRRIPWSEFARYEIHDEGVFLSPDGEPQPFSALRGLFIRWNSRRDELLALLDFYLHSHAQPANSSPRSTPPTSAPPT